MRQTLKEGVCTRPVESRVTMILSPAIFSRKERSRLVVEFRFRGRVDPHLRIEAHFFAEDLRVRVVAPWKSPWRGRHFCLHIFPEAGALFALIIHNQIGASSPLAR